MHFILIQLFILNQIFLEPNGIFLPITAKFISCLYAGIVGLVLLICLGFYIREIVFKCKADFRDYTYSEGSEVESINDNNNGKAVFDVQKEYSIDDHVE